MIKLLKHWRWASAILLLIAGSVGACEPVDTNKPVRVYGASTSTRPLGDATAKGWSRKCLAGDHAEHKDRAEYCDSMKVLFPCRDVNLIIRDTLLARIHDNQYIERIDTTRTWVQSYDKPYGLIVPVLIATTPITIDTTWADYVELKLTKKQADWFMWWIERQASTDSVRQEFLDHLWDDADYY